MCSCEFLNSPTIESEFFIGGQSVADDEYATIKKGNNKKISNWTISKINRAEYGIYGDALLK